MSKPQLFTTGAILNSAPGVNGNPFADFQTQPPDDANRDSRHYFESVAATTEVNRNLYQFEPQALEMLAEGFKSGKTLTINHEKGQKSYIGTLDNALGYGATVDAVYLDGKLYVASYISLNKTYPKGPFGTSEELRDAVVDGFVNSVSQSVFGLKARCSACNLSYPESYRDYENENTCRHYRGQQVILEENGEKIVKTVHVIIEAAEAIELSLVQMGADRGSGITKKSINLSLSDFVDEDRYNFLFGNNTQPTNGGTPDMSAEIIQALTTRAETAERNLASITTEKTVLENQSTTLTAEKTILESQSTALTAEKTALESQVKILTAERDTLKESVASKEKEISSIKQVATENELVIADGQAAREQYEKEYLEAYVAAIGDDCTSEDEELQKETCKSFSIEVLKKKTEGLKKSAAANYPPGKSVQEGGSDPSDADASYPLGV